MSSIVPHTDNVIGWYRYGVRYQNSKYCCQISFMLHLIFINVQDRTCIAERPPWESHSDFFLVSSIQNSNPSTLNSMLSTITFSAHPAIESQLLPVYPLISSTELTWIMIPSWQNINFDIMSLPQSSNMLTELHQVKEKKENHKKLTPKWIHPL